MSSGDRGEDPVKFTPEGARKVLSMPFLKAFLRRPYKVNKTHDIPYVAGYSRKGDVIYIDRDFPRWIWAGHSISCDAYLTLHEVVEKALIDALAAAQVPQFKSTLDDLMTLLRFHGKKSVDNPVDIYYHCHGVATAIEEQAVTQMYGVDGFRAYDDFMAKQVKKAEDERIRRVPYDLDMTPYQGDDHMDRTLRRVMNAVKFKPRGRWGALRSNGIPT